MGRGGARTWTAGRSAPRVGDGRCRRSATVPDVLRVLAVGYAAVLLALGTQPSHPEASSVGFLQTALHPSSDQAVVFRALVDVVGNVAVFVPLGLLVMAAWRIPALGLVSGLLVGGVCELVQLAEPGRVASLTDVLTNTAGGVLGAVLILGRARRAAAPPRADAAVRAEPALVSQP